MKRASNHLVIILGILAWICLHQSCTHDSLFMDEMEPDPMDTMVVDTMIIDTTGVGIPCDPDVIYFEKDILPIMMGSCAFAGCHDASTATAGVVLDSYANVIETAEVEGFDLEESKLYRVMTSDDDEKVMPPSGKLENDQINKIARWILQGANDLDCDEESTPCEVEDMSYADDLAPMMVTHCNGCHGTGIANGGIITDNYGDIKTIADDGRLFGSINWDPGYEQMPQGQDQLSSCQISQIKSWIDNGAQNN